MNKQDMIALNLEQAEIAYKLDNLEKRSDNIDRKIKDACFELLRDYFNLIPSKRYGNGDLYFKKHSYDDISYIFDEKASDSGTIFALYVYRYEEDTYDLQIPMNCLWDADAKQAFFDQRKQELEKKESKKEQEERALYDRLKEKYEG